MHNGVDVTGVRIFTHNQKTKVMPNQIVNVSLQIVKKGNNPVCTLFTQYKNHKGFEYEGFNVYYNEDEAKDVALKMTNRCDIDFQSVVDRYYLITFDENGVQTKQPIITKGK